MWARENPREVHKEHGAGNHHVRNFDCSESAIFSIAVFLAGVRLVRTLCFGSPLLQQKYAMLVAKPEPLRQTHSHPCIAADLCWSRRLVRTIVLWLAVSCFNKSMPC